MYFLNVFLIFDIDVHFSYVNTTNLAKQIFLNDDDRQDFYFEI